MAGVVADEADSFRREHAYTELVCAALRKHEAMLRRCFGRLALQADWPASSAAALRSTATSSQTAAAAAAAAQGISCDAWVHGMRNFKIVGGDLSERDALNCFIWSRMVVENAATVRGQAREHTLPFEGWLEAVCHLATLKALPTEAEMEASGSVDAGEHMLKLMNANDPSEYERALKERGRAWCSEPPRDLARCVEHTIAILGALIMG